MLGYYGGWGNPRPRPITHKAVVHREWATLPCAECNVDQTHYKKDGATQWRCAICQTTRDGGSINVH
jgi:ribosomal protein L37AE/L43A